MSSSDQPDEEPQRALDSTPPGVEPKMDRTRTEGIPCSIAVEPLSDDSGYMLRFRGGYQFHSQAQVMNAARDALVEYLDGRFLSIKYAALVESVEIQVVHDPSTLVFYYDPLAIFRNMRDYVNQYRNLVLLRFYSRSHYFRKKHHAPSPVSKPVDRHLGKTVSVRTDPKADEGPSEAGE